MATRGRVTASKGGTVVATGPTATTGDDLTKGLKEGGGGKDGHLNLQDKNGKLKVRLVAKDKGGRLILNGSDEKQRLRIDAENAKMHIGGNGKGGNITLLRSTSTIAGQVTVLRPTIELDGENGNLFLKDNSGTKNRISLEGNAANIWLGGNGSDGSILLFNKDTGQADIQSGTASIWLSGSNGDIVLRNADCAEEFDIDAAAEVIPGTVMVLNREGKLQPSGEAYDKRVAGVISGAGDYKPGIVLDRQEAGRKRLPLALVGKVFCQVDAQFSPIEVGDLLTTSPTSGHAMRAGDPLKAFGAVIGKALRPLTSGRGLIPILIALQ